MHQLALLFSLMLCPQARHAGAVPHDGAAGATHGPAAAATARAGPQDRPGPVVLEGGRAGSRALLVALHGGSFAGAEALQLAERCRDELHAAARAEGLRLLVPVAPDPETVETVPVEGATDRGTHESGAARPVQGVYQVPWLSAAGEARVLALIDEELAAHRADPARICLAGHGAGATGALALAARHSSRFAAVAVWAGTPAPLWDDSMHVIALAEDPVPALAEVPLYLWSARDDPWLDRATWSLFTSALQARHAARGTEAGGGRPVRAAPLMLVEEATGGHGYGGKGPAPGLHFLKAQRRAQPP